MDTANGWRKSSHSSGNGGDCVEVAGSPGHVAVRDSKDVGRGALRISPGEWHRFLGALDRGELDR
ncbi:DUF397 domain-containing protein [Sphaerisporangium rubeum]|uniref:DUF397 domain-containing protein n=1 Tax=Sphaerisporangium rubeum TaxID=321317 RepID=UPI00161FD990|nr:DUF397 domain-containing protein [Sphaerisporangium rubeum]